MKNLSSNDAVVAVLLEQLGQGREIAAYLAKPFQESLELLSFLCLCLCLSLPLSLLLSLSLSSPGIEVLDTSGVWSSAGQHGRPARAAHLMLDHLNLDMPNHLKLDSS